MQGSEWLVPQVALLYTRVGEDQCRVNPLQRYTHRAIIIIIIIIIISSSSSSSSSGGDDDDDDAGKTKKPNTL